MRYLWSLRKRLTQLFVFLKLAKSGITGKFYNVLRNMYSNPIAYIKLSGHISNRFKVLQGTEQGHPLSPDLFKNF